MILTYNSSKKTLPGGGPQRAYLGGIIFIIKYNGAFLRPPVPRPIRGPVLKSKTEKVKFVDDGTVAVSVDLRQCLVADPVDRVRPLQYHERTRHIFPPENNLLQYYIRDTEHFTKSNNMVINKTKTTILSFSRSRKWDFPPELKFNDGSSIPTKTETKLVGVIISQNLSWQKNTEYICAKARRKIWILRRMVKMDMDIPTIFDVYTKEVRSLLELAVPVWHSGLTRLQSRDIERIQKISFKIILGPAYENYNQACKYLATQSLEDRRLKLCLKFARKNLKSDNCLFKKVVKNVNTRQSSKLVQDYKCRTSKYRKSSIPYLARLLNSSNQK